ncbi:MAG: glycosyltransferase family 2 protein [Luteitalea sp.]
MINDRSHVAVPYPAIEPVSPGTVRPFWSVMIPTYHCAEYLGHTLRSVLEQALPADDMQIEVVDDGSVRDDPASVVAEVGQGRVAFFQQPRNVGPQATFTTCVRRARGHWVHVLHGDDMVRHGFYQAMRRGSDGNPSIGAACCRVITIDERNQWLEMSAPQQPDAGVLSDPLTRLAVFNHIMFPSVVVRRSAYEQVGGFHPSLFHSADWDMWKRLAARVPVWYEPEPLALYRIHTRSDTSRLMQTGANIADARHAIDIAEAYLPAADAGALSRRARRYHGLYAIELARERIRRGDWASARAQIRAGLRCDPSPRVLAAVLGALLFRDDHVG